MISLRKILVLVLSAFMLVCSGCSDNNISDSGKDALVSETDEYYKKAHQEKLCFETCEKVYNALKDHDADTLKEMFCQKVKDENNLDVGVETLLDFISGDIVSYERISSPATSERVRDGKTERLNGVSTIKNVTASDGNVYDINVSIVLIYKEKQWEGVTQIGIYQKDSDAYCCKGQEFVYDF
ncbi:MAG: DUF5104 domain-containing protein [Ruminococcus sp.]|nr:DUF5104 domain-containing protein [Ruminococcus sp.]